MAFGDTEGHFTRLGSPYAPTIFPWRRINPEGPSRSRVGPMTRSTVAAHCCSVGHSGFEQRGQGVSATAANSSACASLPNSTSSGDASAQPSTMENTRSSLTPLMTLPRITLRDYALCASVNIHSRRRPRHRHTPLRPQPLTNDRMPENPTRSGEPTRRTTVADYVADPGLVICWGRFLDSGNRLRSIIRPFNLSLYYDPRCHAHWTMLCAYGASRGDPCTIS